VLTEDNQTLGHFNITRPCVVQCVISEWNSTPPSQTNNLPQRGMENDLDLSMVPYVFYGMLLVGSWTAFLWYDTWFSNIGIVILSILSLMGYFIVI
jgi:hypothetical protein